LRLATIGAAVVTAALLLTACGSSKKSSSTSSAAPAATTSTSTSTPSAAAAKTQDLELYSFRFSPGAILVKPGQKVTVHLKNEANVEHNFSIASMHLDKDVPAGKKATVTFTAPKSGMVQFFCSYHKASYHMVGAVLVNGVKSTTKPTTPPTTSTSSGGSGY
jgi:plastocyanin